MDPAEITLRIVPLDRVILHEGLDPDGITRLAAALKTDGVLNHPPIVTQVETETGEPPFYIVLDGATRTSALRALGCRDALVQVVDYSAPEVSLNAWYHLLQGIAAEELLAEIARVDGVHLLQMDHHHAESALALRTLICYLMLRDRTVWGVKAADDPAAQTEALNRVVNIYRGRAVLYRVVTTNLDLLLHEYPDLSALVVFPRYAPAEVMHLALNNVKLPMGITRHLIGGRVLNVKLDLQLLMSDEPLAQKNEWLQHWLLHKIHARKVRFYQEPLFVFEE